jgi:Zn-dependent protease with chaperone function
MKIDRATRSFAAIMVVALLLGALVLCGALADVLVPLVVSRVARGGLAGVVALAGAAPFLLMVAASLALAARALAGQAWGSRKLARRVQSLAIPLGDELAAASTSAGLAGRVVLVDAAERFSFAYGLLSPRVAVSRGLLDAASSLELQAVLQHERYHVCQLDPLKALVAETVAAGLFFMPAVQALNARYEAARELAADRRAVTACGRSSLAGALLKAVSEPDWPQLTAAAAITGAGPGLLAARVTQLEAGAEPHLIAPGASRVLASALGMAVLAGAFMVAVATLGGPAAAVRATGNGSIWQALFASLVCAAPYAGTALACYAVVATRTRRRMRREVKVALAAAAPARPADQVEPISTLRRSRS